MVLEVALIDVRPGSEESFAADYLRVRDAIRDSPGCSSVRMTHGIESPSRYVLLVEWTSMEAHQAFRDSDKFAIWRGGVGPHFDGPPRIEHFADIDT
jgi:heme-degrading monooxygenase HmoA